MDRAAAAPGSMVCSFLNVQLALVVLTLAWGGNGWVTFPFGANAYFFDDRDGNTSGLSSFVCRSICRQPVDRFQTEVQKVS